MATPDLDDLIERARASVVAALPDVVAVYVFGSAATGHYGPESDLDLAILASVITRGLDDHLDFSERVAKMA